MKKLAFLILAAGVTLSAKISKTTLLTDKELGVKIIKVFNSKTYDTKFIIKQHNKLFKKLEGYETIKVFKGNFYGDSKNEILLQEDTGGAKCCTSLELLIKEKKLELKDLNAANIFVDKVKDYDNDGIDEIKLTILDRNSDLRYYGSAEVIANIDLKGKKLLKLRPLLTKKLAKPKIGNLGVISCGAENGAVYLEAKSKHSNPDKIYQALLYYIVTGQTKKIDDILKKHIHFSSKKVKKLFEEQLLWALGDFWEDIGKLNNW